MAAKLVEGAAGAAVVGHDGNERDALVLLFLGNILHLLFDLRELFLHLRDQSFAALLLIDGCCKEADVGMDVLHRRRRAADDDRHAERTHGISVLAGKPRRDDDDVGRERGDLLDRRTARDDRGNFPAHPRHIRMLLVRERVVDRRHALRLDKTEHHFVRARADRQDALGLMRNLDDSSFRIGHTVRARRLIPFAHAPRQKERRKECNACDDCGKSRILLCLIQFVPPSLPNRPRWRGTARAIPLSSPHALSTSRAALLLRAFPPCGAAPRG